MDALKVSAAEFRRSIGRYQDLALTKPIAVTRNGRERTVLISTEEYARLKRRDREVLGLDIDAYSETRPGFGCDGGRPDPRSGCGLRLFMSRAALLKRLSSSVRKGDLIGE